MLKGRPIHPEHAEHRDDPGPGEPRVVRLDAASMAEVTIVVRCGAVRRARVRLAMALMRLAARIGGFKAVRLERVRADS